MKPKDKRPGLIPKSDALFDTLEASLSNQVEPVATSQLSLLRDFLSRLDAFAPNDEVPDQIRVNIILILEIIIEGLQPFLEHQIGRLDTGEDIVRDTGPIVFMKRLLNTIKDLDNGKTHLSLLKNSKGKTALHSINDQEFIDVLLEAVDVVKLKDGFKSRREAASYMEQCFRKNKVKFHDQPITAKLLKSLRDRRNAKKVK